MTWQIAKLSADKRVIQTILDQDGNLRFDLIIRPPELHGEELKEWVQENWGVRGLRTSILDWGSSSIILETSWINPSPALVELSRIFPNNVIQVESASKSLGKSVYFYKLINGTITEFKRYKRLPKDAETIPFELIFSDEPSEE